jgi:hypothetical protein
MLEIWSVADERKKRERKKERKENGDFFSNYKNIIFKNKLYFPYFFSRKK